jgi:hypothetical protein
LLPAYAIVLLLSDTQSFEMGLTKQRFGPITEVRLELNYDTGTRGTGCSIASTMTVSAAASACCDGSGAFTGAFFVTVRFVLALVTRFLDAVLAATRLATFVRAARLSALPRFDVALRAAPRFFR